MFPPYTHERTPAARDWRAIKKQHLEPEEAAEVPVASTGLADLLQGEPDLVDPEIAAALRAAADDLDEVLGAGGYQDNLAAATDALAVDLLNGTGNVVQRLAQAALWIYNSRPGQELRRAPGYVVDGFSDQFPKEAKRLGRLLAKLSVWGPVAAGGGALAGKFGWLVPIVRLFTKDAPEKTPEKSGDKQPAGRPAEKPDGTESASPAKPKAALKKAATTKPAGRGRRAGRDRPDRDEKPD